MQVFPGSKPPEIVQIASEEQQGYNELLIKMHSHTGTHIDLPCHLYSEGLSVDTSEVSRFVGRGIVVDCRETVTGKVISEAFLRQFEKYICNCEFVLFYTAWDQYWGADEYVGQFPVLDSGAAEYLLRFNLKGAGMDTISFDPVNSSSLDVHRILLSHNILLAENLTNLGNLPREFIFMCLPLKIIHGDGSPVRAVAITEEDNTPVFLHIKA